MKEQDCLRRFLFEELGVRGEWVKLDRSWVESKQHQALKETVQEQLGQALAAAVLLSATIKFAGTLILQIQGDGDLKTLVAHSTNQRKIRVLARSNDTVSGATFSEMIGKGRLVITIEPDKGEPYQGIVAIEKDSLAENISHYFQQSEQLKTQIWLFANETQAAGLLIQELPDQEDSKLDWERISLLANTITQDELLSLNSEEILYRLFNDDKVRLFDPELIKFECGCSRNKVEKTLLSLGREEIDAILNTTPIIEVNCEFCGIQQTFNSQQVDRLFSM